MRTLCADNKTILPGLMALVTGWRELGIPRTMFLSDMKILFLVTALAPGTP